MILRSIRCLVRYSAKAKLQVANCSHYDSQSGLHFKLSDKVTIFPTIMRGGDICALEVSDSALSDVEIVGVRAADQKSLDAAVTQLKTSLKANTKRCYILDAFSISLGLVHSVAATLCDAGCSQVVLTDSSEVMSALDGYDVSDVLEEVLLIDVPGAPMSMRVGLRASSEQRWREHVASSLDLSVKHLDASVATGGGYGGAPDIASLQAMLSERSLEHSVGEVE